MKDLLGRTNFTAKGKAINVIENPDFYSKEEVKTIYTKLSKDSRVEILTRNKLLDGLRKVYKSK